MGESGLFFVQDGALVAADQVRGLVKLDPTNFNAYTSRVFEFVRRRKDGNTEFQHIPYRISSMILNSPWLWQGVPNISVATSCPVFDKEWNFVGKPGFHGDIYYHGPAVTVRKGNRKALNTVLEGFLWESRSDRANFVATLLTGITMPRWVGAHPLTAVSSNRCGVGKTTLAQTMSVIIDGRVSFTISYKPTDENLEEELATRVRFQNS